MNNNIDLDISNYLETGANDYYYGMSLLSKVCRNKSLINFLIRSETDNNNDKLIYELDKHLTNINYEKKEEQIESETDKFQTTIVDTTTINESFESNKQKIDNTKRSSSISKLSSGSRSHINDNLFVKIQSLKTIRNKIYAKRAYYHGQLHGAVSTIERYELAKLIMPLQKEIDFYNDSISIILSSGQISLNNAESSFSVKEYKRIENLKIYIRRYKNKANKAESIKIKENHLTKFNQYQKELNKILSLNE